ncbi:MAG: endo-beta-N-acetylglucosaminidase F1, partial [Muribaculaceae bacterium]|nr:endo-beta-N-acetylglucosaminidase F1 [Muribaculaceae bacterium]
LQNEYPDLFCTPSSAAGARLCYETKKAMPDKLMTLYRLGNLSSFAALSVDGTQVMPGEYLDMIFEDYGRGHTPSNFQGVSNADWAIYSQEFAQGRYASSSRLEQMLQNGHKLHMVFAMDPHRNTFSGNLTALNRCAEVFYDSTCTYDGTVYEKDWN